jgi:hypothetical protein
VPRVPHIPSRNIHWSYTLKRHIADCNFSVSQVALMTGSFHDESKFSLVQAAGSARLFPCPEVARVPWHLGTQWHSTTSLAGAVCTTPMVVVSAVSKDAGNCTLTMLS